MAVSTPLARSQPTSSSWPSGVLARVCHRPSERIHASIFRFEISIPTIRLSCGILHSLPCSYGLSRPCTCSGLGRHRPCPSPPLRVHLRGSRPQGPPAGGFSINPPPPPLPPFFGHKGGGRTPHRPLP